MLQSDRPHQFGYVAREEGQPDAHHDCEFVEVAGGTEVRISARRDSRQSPAGLYDRFLVTWGLKRMLNRQMAAVSTNLADRPR
jgi:hypothetical protein